LREVGTPGKMKLISDLWATGIPDFDPMPVKEPSGIPFNEPIQYQISIQFAPLKISAIYVVLALEFILKPLGPSRKAYQRAKLNYNLQAQIEDMLSVLRLFLTHGQWIKASQQVTVAKS
jgi:hypothetical protein